MRIFHRKTCSNILVFGSTLLLLVSCRQKQEFDPLHFVEGSSKVDVVEPQPKPEAATLADVISQPNVPHNTHQPFKNEERSVSEQQLAYVGRYQTTMSCEQALIHCEQGQVQYILNLLPDGTSHRILIQSGRVYAKHQGLVQSYRQDLWSLDENNHEIIVHLREGPDVFYKINEQDNLLMDLDKTVNYDAQSQHFFGVTYPMPNYAYVLVKSKHEPNTHHELQH
ncbi:hypothetical protein [Acinetobacter rudis]|uniref:Lipoprotein n=1 Tax=Acinetobacter rudis TaxID=632955 RepID=A0AAW8JCH3_9GAMM|nr:hypothetical protein [Acinetobacter rudis]MDQ8937207.1 hypothetical protein [Acinetobacter rudis]MDQ9019422.1 hypothetical protein [Acinetobacter rudis]